MARPGRGDEAAQHTLRESAKLMRKFAASFERDMEAARRARNRKGKSRGGSRSSHVGRAQTRAKGGSRTRRIGRAPKSVSHFRYEHKYSNRAGKNGAPSSSVGKIKYDFDLNHDPKDGPSRVNFAYVSAPIGTPGDALNPLKVAQACEASTRRVDGRMMCHDTISLPDELSEDTRNMLVKDLCDEISKRMDGVPVFAAVHAPDDGEKNWHVHISYPTRIIERDDACEDGFRLGRKIAFEQQPCWREKHGLPKTNRDEFMDLREALAGHCADALEAEGVSQRTADRWRNGHLRVNRGKKNQTTQARARGDDEFVKDNQHREVQTHEGPGFIRGGGETPGQEHNSDLQPLAPEILVEHIVRTIIEEAESKGVNGWEGLRRLAADKGLTIHYNQTRLKSGKVGQVSGLRYEIGGIKMSGKSVGGLSLGGLRSELQAKGLGFAESPPEYAPPPPLGEGWQQARMDAVHSAFGIIPQTPAPAPPKAQTRTRTKRTSSKGRANASIDLNKVMADLSTIPDEPAQVDTAPPPVIDLSDESKNALVAFASYEKKETLGLMRRRLDLLQSTIDKQMENEPSKTKGLMNRKNPAYEKWRLQTNESIERLSKQAQALERWLEVNIYNDPELLLELHRHHQEREKWRLDAALDAYKKSASQTLPGFKQMAQERMTELRREYPHVEAFALEQARLADEARRGSGQSQSQGQRSKQKG